MYEGKKVRLRAFRVEDAESLVQWMNDLTLSRQISGGGRMPMLLEEEREWILQYGRQCPDEANFAVETLEGRLIGSCGYRNVNWRDRTCTVGWQIADPEMRGQGLGTDLIQTLLRILFWDLDMHKVSLEVFSHNVPAVRLYDRLGFVREGVFREQIYAMGRRWDLYRYSLLKREWEENWKCADC